MKLDEEKVLGVARSVGGLVLFVPDEVIRTFAQAIANMCILEGYAVKKEPTTKEKEAYAMLDRFLRNNLDDSDYAEYSAALELIF